MWRMLAKRMVALALSVMLTTGFAAVSFRAVDTHTDITVAMSAPAGVPMPGEHDGCAGDQKAAAPGACGLACAGTVALPVIAIVFDAIPVATVERTVAPVALGRVTPPDTPPPKPISLG